MRDIRKRLVSTALAIIMTATVLPGPAYATVIGGGDLHGLTTAQVSGSGRSRYDTNQIRPDTDDYVDLQETGATRFATMDSTRMMYEFEPSSGTLIVHGYGSTAGAAGAIEGSAQTPGTIGGGVLKEHRASWLDGFYPYLWDGYVNGPEATDPGTAPTRPDDTSDTAAMREYQHAYSVWRERKEYYDYASGSGAVYKTHNALSASMINYIIIDDLQTNIRDDLGLTEQRVHDSYDMSEVDYTSGITEIAPYTFANLYNLKAVDFDASQIKKIGEYAFAGCEKLGSGSMKDFEVTVTYHGTTYLGADRESSTSRKVRNHDYNPKTRPDGCDPDCDGKTCTKHDDEPCYDEKEHRIILPHNLASLGEHAFQNCPEIQEYVIHEDNTVFIASCGSASEWHDQSHKPWSGYTAGVIYSDSSATEDGLKDTAYTKLRSAVMSDYQNVPEAYRKFWSGPFGETEPMPLEWYVKSWNPKKYVDQVYGKDGATNPFGENDHFNWTQVEAAINKAKAASGHHSTDGVTVTTVTDAWKSSWPGYLPTTDRKYPDYQYIESWWNDDFFDSGTKNYGYNRANYKSGTYKDNGTAASLSVHDGKAQFDALVNHSGTTNFNTLFLYPEGKTDSEFRIFPGEDPAEWKEAESKTPVTVIGPFAFSNSKYLNTINMSACNELTTFGQGTFLNCRVLTRAIFPEAGYTQDTSTHPNEHGREPNYALTRLADDMFSQCVQLSRIDNLDRDCGKTYGLGGMELTDVETKPGSCYSTVREFGQNCFHKCMQLTMSGFRSGSHIAGGGGTGFPDTLLIIGQSAFHTCKKLNNVDIHKNIEIIGDYAFSDCYWMSNITFEDKQEDSNGGTAQDRIKDHRNGTSENKDSQFYISGEFSAAGQSLALQLGNKTFEHCSSLSHLQVGSTWLIQKTTFQNAIYVTRIDLKSPKGTVYEIMGYEFQNGATGQGGSRPDRAGAATGATKEYFEDCAYHKGLKRDGDAWVKDA